MMFRRRDPVQEAVALATLQAQFNSHQVKCTEDKAEIRSQLQNQNAERQKMHSENQTKFAELAKSNKWLQRSFWMAAGAYAAFQFLASNGLLKVPHP